MSIRESNLSNISVVETFDYLRAVSSSGESRKALVSDVAKTIVENYSGSNIGGKIQTIQSALEIDAEVLSLFESLGWEDE